LGGQVEVLARGEWGPALRKPEGDLHWVLGKRGEVKQGAAAGGL
jgi:hypothetical protein